MGSRRPGLARTAESAVRHRLFGQRQIASCTGAQGLQGQNKDGVSERCLGLPSLPVTLPVLGYEGWSCSAASRMGEGPALCRADLARSCATLGSDPEFSLTCIV